MAAPPNPRGPSPRVEGQGWRIKAEQASGKEKRERKGGERKKKRKRKGEEERKRKERGNRRG